MARAIRCAGLSPFDIAGAVAGLVAFGVPGFVALVGPDSWRRGELSVFLALFGVEGEDVVELGE